VQNPRQTTVDMYGSKRTLGGFFAVTVGHVHSLLYFFVPQYGRQITGLLQTAHFT